MTAQQIVSLLAEKQLTVATAESCTAGLLSAAITAVSGASAVFGCGVSAYSAEIKHGILGVPTAVLEQYGTVSKETATAMANGIRRLADSTIGVAITGVAGPNETEGKPVGRVHIALASKTRVWLRELTPKPSLSREDIRQNAVVTAFEMIEAFATAYPTPPAGSLPLATETVHEVVIPSAPTKPRRRFLALLLPWKDDTIKERIIKCICLLVAWALLIGSGYGVYRLANLSENKSLYSDLQNIFVNEQTEHANDQNMLARFESLYSQNADIGGWLRVDGTSINYPIMKNAGSNYYATHNFRQEYSLYGAPFFDKQNNLMSATAHNKVLIVYGNNTGDGQMFSELTAYRQLEFFKEHQTIELSTLFAAHKWAVFGAMVLDPDEINAFDYANISFPNNNAFTQYVANIQKRSLFKTDVTVNADDNVLLLVTTAKEEYGFENALFVVACKRLQEGETLTEDRLVSRNTTVLMPRQWVYKHRGETAKVTTTPTTAATTVSTNTNSTTRATTKDDVHYSDNTTAQEATETTVAEDTQETDTE